MPKCVKVFTTIVIISVLVIGFKYYRQGQIKNLFEREITIAENQTIEYEKVYYRRGQQLFLQELLCKLGNFVETEHGWDKIVTNELPSRERTMKLQWELHHDTTVEDSLINFRDEEVQYIDRMFDRWLTNDFSNSMNDYNHLYDIYVTNCNRYLESVDGYGKAVKSTKLAETFQMNKDEIYYLVDDTVITYKIIHYYYTGADGKRVYTSKVVNSLTGKEVKSKSTNYNTPN